MSAFGKSGQFQSGKFNEYERLVSAKSGLNCKPREEWVQNDYCRGPNADREIKLPIIDIESDEIEDGHVTSNRQVVPGTKQVAQ